MKIQNRHCEKPDHFQVVQATKQSSYKLLALLPFLALFALTGCVTRDQADAKLARGCAAGVEAFLSDGYKIASIKDQIFRDDPALGKDYREVRLFAVESDGWAETDKEYKCIFNENMAIFGMNHTASLYQLQLNGQTYGKEGDKILGTFEDQLKLTESVDKAMNAF